MQASTATPTRPAPGPGLRVIHAPTALTQRIAAELEAQRRSGPLAQITIPPCPDLLIRLQAALAEAEPDLNEVGRIAASDVAMAATLLRNANSALHAGDQPVQTVGGAMNRLGLDRTATLLTEVLLKQSVRADHPRLRGFWDQAGLRAAALHFIARQLPGIPPDLAQLYGLFCHVGIPVLMQRMPGYSGTLAEADARRDRSMVATENANHRTDHAVVGALVARVWRVAPPVMAAIRLHHDGGALRAEGTDPEVRTLIAMGLLAEDAMRQRLGLPSELDHQQHAATAMEWLQITADDWADWQPELGLALDQV